MKARICSSRSRKMRKRIFFIQEEQLRLGVYNMQVCVYVCVHMCVYACACMCVGNGGWDGECHNAFVLFVILYSDQKCLSWALQ